MQTNMLVTPIHNPGGRKVRLVFVEQKCETDDLPNTLLFQCLTYCISPKADGEEKMAYGAWELAASQEESP